MSNEWHLALFEFELLLNQSYLFRPVYAVVIPQLQDFIDPTFLFLGGKGKPEWIWRASVPIHVMKFPTR